jgi:hypothetical protein
VSYEHPNCVYIFGILSSLEICSFISIKGRVIRLVSVSQNDPVQRPVSCRISASMEVYSVALIATAMATKAQMPLLGSFHTVSERRPEFGVCSHIHPDLL